MKGTYSSDDDARAAAGAEPVGGTYIDARGVRWTVTVQQPASGTGAVTWLAVSEGDDDNRRWFSQQGATYRTRGDLFDSIDAFAASKADGGGGGWLLLALLLFAALSDKRR